MESQKNHVPNHQSDAIWLNSKKTAGPTQPQLAPGMGTARGTFGTSVPEAAANENSYKENLSYLSGIHKNPVFGWDSNGR